MSDHLSALVLDEVAAGLVPAPPHLADCATCRERLATVQASRAAFAQHPEAARVLGRLTAATPAPAVSRRRFVPFLAAGLAAAAGLLLLVQYPSDADDGTRLKGAARVELLDERGVSVTRAAVGQRLTLAVGSAGATHAVVFAEGADGSRTQLWPETGAALAPLPGGARVPLLKLDVTPGAVTVIARFADAAVATDAPGLVEARLRLEVP